MKDLKKRIKELEKEIEKKKTEAKNRIKELENEIENGTKGLQNTLQQINALQAQSQRMDTMLTSQKGGLLELRKLLQGTKNVDRKNKKR